MGTVEEIGNKLGPLFNDEGLRLVVLIGSMVSGHVRRQSDIDLAFLYDGPVDILSLTNKVIRLLHTDNVDVVDLRRASPLLKFSAAKNCKVIYERIPGTFNEFYSLAFRRYVDTKKLRDARRKTIKLFLESRGLV